MLYQINNHHNLCEPALVGRQVKGWELVIFFLRFSNNLLTPAFKLGISITHMILGFSPDRV